MNALSDGVANGGPAVDLFVLIGLAVAAIVAAAGLWIAESRKRRRVARRVSALAGERAEALAQDGARPLLLAVRRDPLGLVVGVFGWRTPMAAPVPVSRPAAFGLAVAAALVAYPLLHDFFKTPGWSAGIAAVAAFVALPRFICAMNLSRQRFRLLEQMPETLGLLIRAARTGTPISEGVQVIARETHSPTADEFQRAAHAVAVGVPVEEALEEIARRTGMPEYRFFVTAIALQRETGGSLAETLENLANTVRARKILRLKAKALSSEARSSSYVLAALPFITGGAMVLLNPQQTDKLFGTDDGRFLLGLACALLTVGIGSMQMLIRRLS